MDDAITNAIAVTERCLASPDYSPGDLREEEAGRKRSTDRL
jgi:hypothetical protein